MNPDYSAIPQNIQKALLTESGNRCANPACNTIIDSDTARHCVVFQPGITHVDNFVLLCTTCHHAYANGQINQAALENIPAGPYWRDPDTTDGYETGCTA